MTPSVNQKRPSFKSLFLCWLTQSRLNISDPAHHWRLVGWRVDGKALESNASKFLVRGLFLCSLPIATSIMNYHTCFWYLNVFNWLFE